MNILSNTQHNMRHKCMDIWWKYF